MSHKAAEASRRDRHDRAMAAMSSRRQRRASWLIWAIVGGVVVAIVAAMLFTARPESSDATRTAPDFTLTDTAGNVHRLSDHRGENVLLYFSEGAGCQACLVQMGEIERQSAAYQKANVTVLPVVMNTKEQIVADMAANGVKTPFLLDDGTVSKAYGTLGKGMHAGLPGHSFVLINPDGKQLWYGDYPSMWLAPQDLLKEVQKRV